MGFFDTLSGAVSSGLGYLSGAAERVWEGIDDAWSDTGPTAAGPGGGWARRLGTQIGDIGESIATGLVAQATPMPGGGRTGAGPVGMDTGRSVESILRSYEQDAARSASQAGSVYRNTGPAASQGGGTLREMPQAVRAGIIQQEPGGFMETLLGPGPPREQVVGAGLPAVIAGSAVGDILARGAEYAVSPEGQQMIGGLWDLVRGRTATPGGAPVDARMDVDPATGEERVYPLQFERQGPMLPSTISAPLPYGGRLFKQTYSGVRANSIVMVRHPVTQAPVFFRHVGRPILFSGDFATARRVDRIAKRAKKSRRGR